MIRSLALLLGLCACGTAAAQTVTATLEVQPRTFTMPQTLTVTWSSTGATGCVADGAVDWVGAKPATGSAQVAGVEGQTTFNLKCSAATVAPVTLSWTNPTKNTDGSAYTDPKSVEVYHATNAAGLPTAVAVALPPTTTNYPFTGLPAGWHYFATKAVNLAGVKSELSATASRDLQPASAMAAPVTVTGSTQPQPPTGVVAIETVGFAVKPNPTLIDYVLDGQVGTVVLGIPCDLARQMNNSGYYAVNRAKYVTWTTNRRPSTVVVKCDAAPAGTTLESGTAPLEDYGK